MSTNIKAQELLNFEKLINLFSIIVTGQYSLVEPDGSVRTVDYTADPVNGIIPLHSTVYKSKMKLVLR